MAIVIGISAQEESPTKKTITCQYCGIIDNCQLPYDKEEGKVIECDKSCMKFDGLAKDGKRIIVRDCGFFLTDECIDGHAFENEDTLGMLCHCTQPNCNLGAKMSASFILISTLLWL